jgi:hypothetical protein
MRAIATVAPTWLAFGDECVASLFLHAYDFLAGTGLDQLCRIAA